MRYYDELITQKRMRNLETNQKEATFKIGDLVWLYSKPSTLKKGSKKLSLLWKGPYKIALIISNTQVVLKDLEYHRLKQPVHISWLKCYTIPRKPWKCEKDSRWIPGRDQNIYEVERILDDRVDRFHKKWYKLRWKDCAPSDDSWVEEKDLKCPDLLEDYLRQKGSVEEKQGRGQQVMIINDPNTKKISIPRMWIE